MSLQPIESGDSQSAILRKSLEVDIPSIDSTVSLLNLMAQDIFTLFLKRIAMVLDSNLAKILYPNLDRSSGLTTSLIGDLAEAMIAERLATRDEAIMTVLPGFYQDSVFQYPLHFQLISVANCLKQQNRFDESEEIIERLIKIATGTLSLSTESRALLSEATITNLTQQPLTEEISAGLDLDSSQQPLSKQFVPALTLSHEYGLGASDVRVRRQLLRWAIERDCCGLVEDVWASEQHINQKESAFGTGADELFWALLSSEYDGMATMLFLLDVAQVSATEELKPKDKLEEVW
ncbi:hypothetical protein DER46DRAFT_642875 [Fusarium sp. MPI-SDFR-AT-0072]|nr:hypothetical protein DER46DRAFT_642875 [Fusarium sp. MPI-SDFR-AT-0072]